MALPSEAVRSAIHGIGFAEFGFGFCSGGEDTSLDVGLGSTRISTWGVSHCTKDTQTYKIQPAVWVLLLYL